jgi:phenylalanyl-tRNA synthetase alpha chain
MTAENKVHGQGHLHPLTQIMLRVQQIFAEMGFQIAEGPEIETEHYNFDALRVAKDHPSRDMQDTFWLPNDSEGGISGPNGERMLPRTHTSNTQIRHLEKFVNELREKNPEAIDAPAPTDGFRIVVPGKVFRNEATDATHEAEFYQVEGMMLAPKVSMADLKGTLSNFYKKLFGPDADVRFRPSYFPFTEPSVEVDMKWGKEGGQRWLEVMGGGLVHPEIIQNAGLDPEKWQAFAFGGGVDRLAMLRFGISDIRLLYSGDLRLVEQF